ncbi:hypothetical protein QUF49_20215 [Fictibacillus sp. b24]|uniref:hypothetical protein n=1 Tax=Fictibacillus sp. b24 TaxID=3055863 RepID=UPI0025A21E98|nr:hypothetical protein [Fictibacillus sp. b24]MDM5318311.1 hypothetical protein [Fictibacillus sp. b24]
MIGVEGVRLLRDRRAGETLKSETYKCGSPPAPRKASTWNGNQLLPKAPKLTKTALYYLFFT